jgi:hypothetical protein
LSTTRCLISVFVGNEPSYKCEQCWFLMVFVADNMLFLPSYKWMKPTYSTWNQILFATSDSWDEPPSRFTRFFVGDSLTQSGEANSKNPSPMSSEMAKYTSTIKSLVDRISAFWSNTWSVPSPQIIAWPW